MKWFIVQCRENNYYFIITRECSLCECCTHFSTNCTLSGCCTSETYNIVPQLYVGKGKRGFSLNQNKDTEVYKISRHIEMQLRHIVVMSAEKYFKYL